jgi:ABC-type Fe3+ transport system substrate-binding protein
MVSRCGTLVLALSLTIFLNFGSAHAADGVDPKLIEAAKLEGQVVWYTTLVVNQIVRPLIQAFEQKYPGIKVNFVPANWQEVAQRVVNEGKAGNVKGDLFDAAAAFYPIRAAGFVERYIPKASANYPAEFKDPSGLWNANIIQILTPAINTNMVSAKDAPKTLEDLLDPKWREKMAWVNARGLGGPPGFVASVLMAMGKDKGMDYLRKLAKQKIANVPSNQRVVLDQCVAGQYPLVLCIYNYHAAISAADGAPVEWLKLNPIQTFGPVALVKNSPHPNAAKLLLEFILSEEGQRIHSEAGYIPTHPNVPAKHATLKPAIGKFSVTTISPDMFYLGKESDEWIRIYTSLFE